MKIFDDFDFAKAFHGHLGPNLVIGIKLGNSAIRALGPETCFQLRTEVHCPSTPPVSCVMDGIQLSTGCTMGKANICHIPAESGIKALFTNTQTGKSVAYQVNGDFAKNAVGLMAEYGEDEASMRTWNADDKLVFEECSI